MSDKSENRFIIFEVERLNQLISTINSLAEEIRGIKSDREANVIYTNKTIKDVLGIQDKLLKKYRDDGLLAFHQVGDKYWYTQADVDQNRAMKLYKFLSFIVFSDGFLKKRYLIDYIIRQSRVSSLDEVLMRLSKLRRAGTINALRDKDCDISIELERIVNEDFSSYLREEGLTQQQIDQLKGKDYLADVFNDDVPNDYLDEDIERNMNHELTLNLADSLPNWLGVDHTA